MNNELTWKYISKLTNDTAVDVLEMKYHFRLPDSLKDCIKVNNGGIPSLSKFEMPNGEKHIFGGLLSFNENDDDKVYDYIQVFENADGNSLKMFPFGLDPFGNFICVEDEKIVFFDHEEETTEAIANSFDEFIAKLHD